MTRSEEAKDRDAWARVIAWLLDRPKALLILAGLLGLTGVVREATRALTPEKQTPAMVMDAEKVRGIVDEALKPVVKAQDKIDQRLGNIETALVMRGLRADASGVGPQP